MTLLKALTIILVSFIVTYGLLFLIMRFFVYWFLTAH